VVEQQVRDLCDREHEHQVEEQLEGSRMAAIGAGRTLEATHAAHLRARLETP
jgi:hypothetical protein